MRKIALSLVILISAVVLLGLSVDNVYAYTVTYYASGDIKTINTGYGTIYTYMDENYWGGTVHQGRLKKVEYSTDSWYEYYYYSDSPDRLSKRITLSSGKTYTDEYYNEDFYKNPIIARDTSGNTFKAYQYFDGSNFRNRISKYDSNGAQLWTVTNPESVIYIDVDAGGNLIVAGDDYFNGLKIRQYKTDSSAGWTLQDSQLKSVRNFYMDSNDNMYILADGTSSDGSITIAKYNSDRTLAWHEIYTAASGVFYPSYITVDNAGNVHAYASMLINGEYSSVDIEYSETGTFLSIKSGYSTYAFHNNDVGRDKSYSNGESYYGYIGGTDKEVVAYMSASTPTTDFGNGLGFTYYDSEYNPTGVRIEFDDGKIAEFRPAQAGGGMITKAQIPGSDTYWFLWGSNVYQGHDNVVVVHKANGDWEAYTFVPDTNDPGVVADKSKWTYIGSISNPETLVLPELGNWWQYYSDRNIVIEFPPVSGDYQHDNQQRVTQRIDHNQYLDTTNIFTWDSDTGHVRRDVSYDFGKDGSVNLVCSVIYSNGTDHNLDNMNSWGVYAFVNYKYWPGTNNLYQMIFLDGQWNWQKSIQYYDNGTTMHHQWVADAHPGVSGDDVAYEYDSTGRLVTKWLDDGKFATTSYWGTTTNKYEDAFFATGGVWVNTVQYYDNGTTMHHQWVADAHPGVSGDDVAYEYDSTGRLVTKWLDDGKFATTSYWGTTTNKYEDAFFVTGGVWVNTVQYYDNGTTMHHQWVADAHPGVSGDDVAYEYDSTGRLVTKWLDDGKFATTSYWGTTTNKYEDAFFVTGGVWVNTVQYYDNGTTMHHQWVADAHPGISGDDVAYEYDSNGVMIRKWLDDGSVLSSLQDNQTELNAILNVEEVKTAQSQPTGNYTYSGDVVTTVAAVAQNTLAPNMQ